jgi:hypothetical protein
MKTKVTPISIPVKSDGRPDIPNITKDDEYKTKTVQTMLRQFLTAHIRNYSSDNLYISYTDILGYVSGKRWAKIPWALLSDKPNVWIKPECTPDGFTWADPSKIRIGDIFLLLDHWRERRRQRLTPLIWVKTCPVLRDVSLSSDERQDYHSDSSSDNLSNNDDRSEEHSQSSPHPNSATLISHDAPQSDHSRSESVGRSDATHSSNNSDAISEVQGDPLAVATYLFNFDADDVWGRLDGDIQMSSPPPLRTSSTQEGPGMSE